MGINNFRDGLEGVILSGDMDEFRHDQTDNGKHGLTSVLELSLTEQVDPFGCSLRQAKGSKFLADLSLPGLNGMGSTLSPPTNPLANSLRLVVDRPTGAEEKADAVAAVAARRVAVTFMVV